MLTTSVGPSLTSQMHEILDLMLPWGISEALFHALEVIASHIPPLLPTIQSTSRALDITDARALA
jgi:FKBP12-rapamycin complex-associated protein